MVVALPMAQMGGDKLNTSTIQCALGMSIRRPANLQENPQFPIDVLRLGYLGQVSIIVAVVVVKL